jgi:magnesium chelatase subunit D
MHSRVMHSRGTFPFSAIVGQDELKLALCVNAVDPLVGGALIRGERGSGKTTVVRALGGILPMQRVVAGCPYRCDPGDRGTMCAACAALDPDVIPVATERMRIVELPVSASLERVVGGIDIETALRHGVTRFSPGILASANRNVLYLDEVNLTSDSVVDALLDVAASGINAVEREGISVTHPARFVLVGTMNPQEGELRPQLLDRFGVCVDVRGFADVEQRAEVADREAAFRRRDPGFAARYEQADRGLGASIEAARAGLAGVSIAPALARMICQTCVGAGVAGHRADVVMHHAAMALAALRSRRRATQADVSDAATLALAHRARRPIERPVPVPPQDGQDDPAEPPKTRADPGNVEMHQPRTPHPGPPDDAEDLSQDGTAPPADAAPPSPEGGDAADSGARRDADTGEGGRLVTAAREAKVDVPLVELRRTRRARAASGKRMLSQATDHRGRYVRSQAQDPVTDVALDATLRAAAPHQIGRGRGPGEPLRLHRDDLRQKVREHKVGSLVVFLVDGSASMGARERMAMTKAVILSLLHDAYVRRDRVAAIVFRGRSAQTVLEPTSSVSVAQRQLADLAVGGSTPMAHGLWSAYQLIRRAQHLDPTLRPLLIMVSDGYPNVAMSDGDPYRECTDIAERIGRDRIDALVVDSARPALADVAVPMYEDLRPAACRALAERMGAAYFPMTRMSANQLGRLVIRLRARR